MKEQKIIKRYSSAFKQKVIAEIASGKYTKSQASQAYTISIPAINYWIKRSGSHHLLNKVIRIQMPKEIDKIKQLEQEKKALESALAQTQLKLINAEATLEIYEEEYGIVKKNFITGSFNALLKKGKDKKASR